MGTRTHNRSTLSRTGKRPGDAVTPRARHRRYELPCTADLTNLIPLADQLFTLREARDILDDPMRDMRYLQTRMGPEIQAHLNYKRLRRGSPETWDAKERILARLAVAIPDVGVADITYEHHEQHLLTIP